MKLSIILELVFANNGVCYLAISADHARGKQLVDPVAIYSHALWYYFLMQNEVTKESFPFP